MTEICKTTLTLENKDDALEKLGADSPGEERDREITKILSDAQAHIRLYDCNSRLGIGVEYYVAGVRHREGIRMPDETLVELRRDIGEALDAASKTKLSLVKASE